MNISSLIASAFGAIIIYKIIIFAYTYYITWKKLSSIPGPFAVPIIGTLELKNTETIIEKTKWFFSLLSRFKNGICTFWVGHVPIVCLYNPDLIQIILSSNEYIEKSPETVILSEWLGNGLVTSQGNQWRRDRKLLTPTFHFSILEQFAEIMSDKTENLIKLIENELAENPEKNINIKSYIDTTAMEIILETTMGISINDTKNLSEYEMAEYRYKYLYVHRLNNWLYMTLLKPIYNFLPISRQIRKYVTCLHEFTDEVIRKRKLKRKIKEEQSDCDTQAKTRKKAFLDFLLDLRDNGNSLLNDEYIKGHVNTFMAAGHDTTSTSICWALFCAGSYLSYQEKIHEELEEVFKDSQKPATTKEILQLKYLDRFIKESRRLYPPIPAFQRIMLKDIELDDYIIPANARVFISSLLVHRNPAVWPDPLKFDPDRFLPENIKSMHPFAYIPFSAGPRNCIGQKFAMLEEKIVLTAIFRKWRIKYTENPADKLAIHQLILEPHQGVSLHFAPKK